MNTTHLIHSYGYLAVFVFVAIESLGVPIPGETAVIAAGAYAGETHKLNPWLLFLVAAVAAIAGNIAGYSIGRKGGFPLALRYGSKIRLDQHKLKVGKYVLDKQGSKVVFFGRFVSVSPYLCGFPGRHAAYAMAEVRARRRRPLQWHGRAYTPPSRTMPRAP